MAKVQSNDDNLYLDAVISAVRKDYFLLDLVLRRRPTRFLPSILPFQQSRAAVKWTVVCQKLRPDRNRGRKSKDGISGTGVVEHSASHVCFYHDILAQDTLIVVTNVKLLL